MPEKWTKMDPMPDKHDMLEKWTKKFNFQKLKMSDLRKLKTTIWLDQGSTFLQKVLL